MAESGSANDPNKAEQGQAPDVRIGGDLVVGNDLAVPVGHTWQVDGDVSIEGDAELRIDTGATLQVQGHPEPEPPTLSSTLLSKPIHFPIVSIVAPMSLAENFLRPVSLTMALDSLKSLDASYGEQLRHIQQQFAGMDAALTQVQSIGNSYAEMLHLNRRAMNDAVAAYRSVASDLPTVRQALSAANDAVAALSSLGIPASTWRFDSGARFDDGLYFDTPPGMIPEVRVSQVALIDDLLSGTPPQPHRPAQWRSPRRQTEDHRPEQLSRQPEPPKSTQALLRQEIERLVQRHGERAFLSQAMAMVALPSLGELLAEQAELEEIERVWLKKRDRQAPERIAKALNVSRATLYRRLDRLKEVRRLIEIMRRSETEKRLT